MGPYVASGPLEALYIEYEDGGSAYFYLYGVGEEEFAGFHDRGDRGYLLLAGGAALADRVDYRVHLVGFDADENGGVRFAEKAADGFDAGGAKATVGQLREQSVRIFGLHNGYDKLHDINPSRAAITRQISSDNESAGRNPSKQCQRAGSVRARVW